MDSEHHPLRVARRLLVLALLPAFVLACEDGGPTDPGGDDTGDGDTDDASPEVVIAAPEDGATFEEGETITFEGSATDEEDGDLNGAALAWTSDADGELGTGATVETTLSVGEHAVELRATDSAENEGTATLTVTVTAAANEAPSAAIGAPDDGATVTAGSAVTFEGSATDPEDGEVTGEALAWSSDVDGDLGTGATLEVSDLTVGAHTIELTATDSEGAEGTASIAITVEEAAPVGPLDWSAITAGGAHTCGITTEAEAWCWGYALHGGLGDGQTDSTTVPVRVAGEIEWSAISAGLLHTCGLSAAGEAYCWGSGSDGRIGNGATNDQDEPVSVAGGHTWAHVDAGAYHTCGVTTADVAYCWGNDIYHEIGDTEHGFDRTEPTPVAGGHTWAMVSAGGGFSCGVTTAGDGYCWGTGNSGRLGYGGLEDQPEPVAVSGEHEWSVIHAGAVHACGITTDGDAYCWGQGSNGAIGNGFSGGDWPDPVLVEGGHTWAELHVGGIPNVSGNMAGHTCGITDTGAAYCWGDGDDGELGSGFHDVDTPTAVAGSHTWADIALGNVHSCGVTADETAMCWGRNSLGQLGDDTTTDRGEPTEVVDP